MKKMNNKGFSLVELIIVIAIMAVLMGVLAPQFIKYVESSRKQKDLSAMGEVANAAQIALSVEEVYNAVASAGGDTVTIADGAQVSSTVPELAAEIVKSIPDEIDFTSKAYATTSQHFDIVWNSSSESFAITNKSWETP